MNSYYYSGDYDSALGFLAGLGVVGGIIGLALIICVIVAYFMAISTLVKTARAKGCPFGSGKLWFLGLFTTPILLGIIVAAQPDRGAGAETNYNNGYANGGYGATGNVPPVPPTSY